jgi:hypothetical protein
VPPDWGAKVGIDTFTTTTPDFMLKKEIHAFFCDPHTLLSTIKFGTLGLGTGKFNIY